MELLHIIMQFEIICLLSSRVSSYGFRNCIQSYTNPDSYVCINRKISEINSIVSDLPQNTKYLNISYNQIRILDKGSFMHTPLLQLLHLDHNRLQNIAPGAFENLGNLGTLYLSYNKISSLTGGAFHGLRNLTYLFLNQNSIVYIDVNAFLPLSNLNFLNLSSNHLKNFSKVVQSIQPLKMLNILHLCNNQLTSLNHSNKLPFSLSQLSLCKNHLHDLKCQQDFLVNISYLDLSYNNVTSYSLQKVNLGNVTFLKLGFNHFFNILNYLKNTTVKPDKIDYSGLYLNDGPKLREICKYLTNKITYKLTLVNNSITYLPKHTFEKCPIHFLDLSINRLKNVNCLEFMEYLDITHLTIEHNLLKKLVNCANATKFLNLTTISFQFNRIWSVDANAFAHTPNLHELQLNMNNIAWLGKYAFNGSKHLKILRLDDNLITDLYNTSFAGLAELETLNLRNNRISVIFNDTFQNLVKLNSLDLGGNKITHLEFRCFRGLQSLTTLFLDSNRITKISSDTFTYVETTLQVLDMKQNELSFDSPRKYLSPFHKLQKLYDLKLQAQQPHGLQTMPRGFLAGLTSLTSLYLSQNRLSHLNPDVFDDLSQLTFLSLSEDCNGVQNLPHGIFKNLTNLHILNLENICLQNLERNVFGNLTQLRKLQLMKNGLKHINVKVLKNMTNLKYLDLRSCPITCTCNNVNLQRWLNQSQVHVVYPYNLSCPSKPTSYFHDFDIHVCDNKIKLHLFCSTFTILLMFIIFPVVYSKFYWRLKYNYFLFLSWLHEHWKSDKELYKYDAFVSYNTHDEQWVYSTMLPMLETCNPSKAFRLCLHHRDFEPGRYIIDNIVDSIHNSRKTICVISRNYLRSEWCSLEMQLASYKLFDEMRDVLVPIFLEKIPERELSIYHRMRKVMLKKTYISWSSEPEAQKLFWAKLTKALKGSSSPSEEGNDGFTVDDECILDES
ncbi:uncharacterized protein O3C94_014551 [Discoglossus pictus]